MRIATQREAAAEFGELVIFAFQCHEDCDNIEDPQLHLELG